MFWTGTYIECNSWRRPQRPKRSVDLYAMEIAHQSLEVAIGLCQLRTKLYKTRQMHYLSVEHDGDMSHPLSFVDRWLCQFLYQNSPLHAHPLPYTYTVQLHRIFYTHFTSLCQQEKWWWRSMHTHFVRIVTKIFWWYLHIWCNYPHLIPTRNNRVPIVQCREDAMPFTRVLLVAILLLLST